MRAANSHPSYQDLSVAAYELLQRLHHLLPVLCLLEVGVARSVGFLHTKRTKRVYSSVARAARTEPFRSGHVWLFHRGGATTTCFDTSGSGFR